MTPSVLNIEWWCCRPISEAKVALGSVPMVYTVLHHPFRFRSSYPTWFLPFPPSPVARLLLPTPLFLFPVPIPVLLVRLSLVCEDQSLMIPPPLGRPKSRPPLRLQVEVQNRLCCNVFCDRIMVPGDVGLHIFQPYCLYIFPRWGGTPSSCPPSAWVAFPRSAAPPCGGNPSAAAQCVGSRPKSLRQIAGWPALWQGKNASTSNCPFPPDPVSLTVWPRFSTPSGG